MSRPVTTRRRKADRQPAAEAAPAEAVAEAEVQAPRSRRRAAPEPAPEPARAHRKIDNDDLLAIAQMDPDELGALLEGAISRTRHEVGDKVQGAVTRVGREDLFIDLGGKSEGTLDLAERPDTQVGEVVEAFIIASDEHGVRLSTRLSGAAAADHLEEARESGVPVEGMVQSRNSGGFTVRVGGVRAFCPVSRISRLPDVDLDAYVGQSLSFRVLETGEKVVLDRRVLQEEEAAEKAEALWQTLQEGDVCRGVVRNVQPFGVFVDVGGVDGLIPKRELSWGGAPIHLAPGQGLEVRVLQIDRETRRLTLSAKDPGADPWNQIDGEFQAGGVYEGEVVRVEAFGAFVALAPGLQGLAHISKLPGGLPKVGDTLTVRLLSIDHERRRLDLGPASDEELAAVGATARGTVTQVLKNGVVVQLDDGRTGWLPAREVELPSGTVLAQRFRPGKPLTARVLQDGADRVTLTLREADAGSWRGPARRDPKQESFGTLGDLFAGLNLKR